MEDEQGSEQDARAGRAAEKGLKRRGILAAAGAVVAGIVAKQASVSVEAAPFPITGASAAADTPATNSVSRVVNITGLSTFVGADANLLNVDTSAVGAGKNVTGVNGNGAGSGASVSTPVAGVKGTIPAGSTANTAGVYGFSQSTGSSSFGVWGESSVLNGVGVYGYCGNGTGAFGQSSAGAGVAGYSASNNGVFGSTSGTGLVAGLYGTSSTAYGILGNTTAAGYSGLTATTSTAGVAALAATALTSSAFAAYFSGLTYVQGNFTVTGVKNAAVMHPDGTHRLFYCTEAPEPLFEDFGEAKLVNGKADVKIESEFALFIHTDAYQVFLTEYDGHNNLYVTNRGTEGFSVRSKDGAASGQFGWRIVGKRKDVSRKRLEKFTPIKYNIPDPDKLPKPPTLPTRR